MGLTHLLEALERDAQREIDRLSAAARAEADGIAAESNTRLAKRRRQELDEVDRRHSFELEQALTAARRAGHRTVLEAGQRLQQRLFDCVRGLLPGALDQETYQKKALPAALDRARAALGEGPVTIRCTPSLRSVIEALGTTTGISVVADDAVGSGFIMQVTDGSVDVIDTLEERLERRRPELTRWMVEQLGAGK